MRGFEEKKQNQNATGVSELVDDLKHTTKAVGTEFKE
jgi:hypothetical protein